ncbi:MAG: enoyl-CoA hydratase/isomerase family protein [Pirellulales bacterium]|nr:enoyl-CoA hydratase/isomerase family protein [Pirellulales bacterium]
MSFVKLMLHDRAGTIVLNRPEKRNALHRSLIEELLQALRDLHAEKRARAVIITGAGSAFCAGMDLGEMRDTAHSESALAQWQADAEIYQELLQTMLRFPKPIIAAVNGPAVAGGLGLVLASDLVLAAPEASFGLPEPKRGLVAGIVSPLLVFRIGAGYAAPLLLTGQMIDSPAAHARGLVHEVVANDLLWARGQELAGEIAVCAPQALLLTKRMLNETIGEQLSTMLTAGAAVSAAARTTPAAAEGLAAFLEKRPPVWP